MLFHQKKNRTIYWRIHTAGLINQVMSVEIGAGIAFMEKIPIYFYKTNIDKNRTIHPSGVIPEKRKLLYKDSKLPTVFDILDIPKSIKYSVNEEHNLSEKIKSSCVEINDVLSYYYKCSNGDHEKEFSENRKVIPPINSDVNFVKFAFGFYSRFFYNRPKCLDAFFSQLTFKKPYLDLAEKIAKYIGVFKGMHIRLTDHANKYDHSPANLERSQELFLDKKIPLFVSTDDKFTIMQKTKIKCFFIDDIILEKFAAEFMCLPFHNEVVFGLISLLIMGYAQEFVGTPGSTFSSYIHRLRINSGLDTNLYYINSGRSFEKFEQNGPYSWNGCDLHTNSKNWWREWKECKLNITDGG